MTYLPTSEAVREWMRRWKLDTLTIAEWYNAAYYLGESEDFYEEHDIYNVLAREDMSDAA